MRTRKATVLASALMCAGCMTQQLYDGPKLQSDEVAHISGDLRFTAGVPVSALLRQVDGRTLSVSESAVDVLPGSHRLLVDCRVQETGTTTRHSLEVEVDAGRRYRLIADTSPGLRECSSVRLEAVD
jgi:hypothetical protein